MSAFQDGTPDPEGPDDKAWFYRFDRAKAPLRPRKKDPDAEQVPIHRTNGDWGLLKVCQAKGPQKPIARKPPNEKLSGPNLFSETVEFNIETGKLIGPEFSELVAEHRHKVALKAFRLAEDVIARVPPEVLDQIDPELLSYYRRWQRFVEVSLTNSHYYESRR